MKFFNINQTKLLTAFTIGLGIGLCIVTSGQAQTRGSQATNIITISDIDDTLKVSHVRNLIDAAINLSRVDNHVRGMSTLLQTLKLRDPRMPIFYLSNAPEGVIGYFHQKFLQTNQFPVGDLILRRDLPQETHKLIKIRQILNATRPQFVIAIGDNGEMDPQIYAQIQQEFPQIRFFTYIHLMYSEYSMVDRGSPLAPNQLGYVTPNEIAMDLALKRFLSIPQVQMVMDKTVPAMMRAAGFEDRDGERGELSFPVWQDCRDFVWPQVFDQVNWGRNNLYQSLKQRAVTRCNLAPVFVR